MNSEWTPEADEKLRAYLARPGYKIPTGIGTEEAACSLAAINLALTGELTGDVPPCMSEVVGEWIIVVQDRMPADIRDSMEWRALLPLAAGTGRDKERERCEVILNWMWGTVLPYLQPIADADGYGPEWRAMCMARTEEAANTARAAASEAARVATHTADYAASAAERAAERAVAWAALAASGVASEAAWAAERAAAKAASRAAARDAALAAAYAASRTATYAARTAAHAARTAASDAAHAAAWAALDPVGVLRKLVDIH